MTDRATIAASFLGAVAGEGLRPPPTLRLLAQRAGSATPRPLGGPADLGSLHQDLVDAGEQQRRGAWYTPAWLAEDLVTRALPDRATCELGPVVDPACGGGVFLLAAAERMVALGVDPDVAVGRLQGCDLDETAVAVTEAALWWWAARHGVDAEPVVALSDALLAPFGPAGAVVGNPPFLGQLRSATTVDAERRRVLQDRHGDAVRPYTDPAWLFALAAVEQVVAGGHVALVLPQSFLAARDAQVVRDRIDGSADLVHTVVDDGRAFTAGVEVCAPILRRRTTPAAPGNDWVGALADAVGVPAVVPGRHGTLGELATVHAGFRDEFYGLVEAVSEADGASSGPRLVTAGGIDPCRLLARGQRFAGRRWVDPVVDVASLQGRCARWADVQSAPKLLVATQTRVLEAVADPDGALLGSVPVLCVRPHDPDLLWHLLAALHAPAATAWLFRRSAGTALSADACRPTKALLDALPVPLAGPAWDRAAEAARAATDGDVDVAEVARLADLALGLRSPDVVAWWESRRPRR